MNSHDASRSKTVWLGRGIVMWIRHVPEYRKISPSDREQNSTGTAAVGAKHPTMPPSGWIGHDPTEAVPEVGKALLADSVVIVVGHVAEVDCLRIVSSQRDADVTLAEGAVVVVPAVLVGPPRPKG
ncbi:MAG: hypothetical protein QOH57_4791 [Mycobacterium sp.]|jgi:creatinine amidohydrolase/Fe(II)-dependent formamide hydrolase-like protein|nr:hypothetical protein [Mycobacterium sp.]